MARERPRSAHRASNILSDYNSDAARKRRKYTGGDVDTDVANHFATDDFDVEDAPNAFNTADTRGSASTRQRRRNPSPNQPTYSSAAAAAAAVQGDGYKPREERSWEEFHPDLDIDLSLAVFSADAVDGKTAAPQQSPNQLSRRASELETLQSPNSANAYTQGHQINGELAQREDAAHLSSYELEEANSALATTPHKRRPGRPPRRPESMLTGLGSPPGPPIIPIPAQNPRERLNLPKPSFRHKNPFVPHEQDRGVQINYVDRSMAHVGFQESEMFVRPEKRLIRFEDAGLDDDQASGLVLESDSQDSGAAANISASLKVEYDMDEQDLQWLDAINADRNKLQFGAIKPAILEITMTQIEKEWHALEKRIPKPNPKPPQTQRPRSSSAAAVSGDPAGPGEEQDSKCTICDDGDCENTNAIVFCDGCDLAVHQECYGVPFIPEGQWLCRRCQLIGRGTPTCIFCPNVEGAFKLTNESRWAHLLCAIWIPEVTLGNTTFMEPVMDVAKVPKQRWKLTCYICNQKMGACIQCGNRNCFQAFHVTCGRKAKLYLKMKSTHGAPANLDASVLKALCDKHVPHDWRLEHDVDRATAEARAYYRRAMRGRLWADSQQSALAMVAPQNFGVPENTETQETQDLAVTATQKRKRAEAQKNIWRMPSGAPIVPKAVVDAVENCLQRFSVTRRKDFAYEACKYWTLKREARRGAALLKRLQLQMESFSTTEISRRDFSAMGAAGRPRLERRIEFAAGLLKDLTRVNKIIERVRDRESEKLKDAELMREVVDTVYFPIVPLLWPIIRKAHHLDTGGFFRTGFREISTKLEDRNYTSVTAFSADLSEVIQNAVNFPQIPGSEESDPKALDALQKEANKLAKRITRAIQQPLEDATRKEGELSGKPYEQELKNLEQLLNRSVRPSSQLAVTFEDGDSETENTGIHSERGKLVEDNTNAIEEPALNVTKSEQTNGLSPVESQETSSFSDHADDTHVNGDIKAEGKQPLSTAKRTHANGTSPQAPNGSRNNRLGGTSSGPPQGPLTPPSSERELHASLLQGGVPWYLEPFDPVGTTVHEERWTGRDVLRGLSEELSEIDDEVLNDLGANGMEDALPNESPSKSNGNTTPGKRTPKKNARRKAKAFR